MGGQAPMRTALRAAGDESRLRRAGFACAASLLLMLAGLALPHAAKADWPLYGHDLANSRSSAAGPSPSEVSSLSQAWEFKSSTGDFTGTPVVANGVLVAGDNGGSIYALNAVTGDLLWSKQVGQPINGTAAINPNARGGPAV